MINYYLLCLLNKDPKKIFASMIATVEDLSYNHVEILRIDTDKKEEISFGAIKPKSRKITARLLGINYFFIKKIPLKIAVTIQEADLILEKSLNKPYSILQLVIIYCKIYLTKVLNWLPYVKLNLDSALIYTELVGNFMRDACKYPIDISTETLRLTEVEGIATKANLTP